MSDKKCVLLAIRDPFERQTISDILAQMDLRVYAMADSQEALCWLEDHHHCDVLMMDDRLEIHPWVMLSHLKEVIDSSAMHAVVFTAKPFSYFKNVHQLQYPIAESRIRSVIWDIFSGASR